MERRTFIKLCSGAAVLMGTRPDLLWAEGATQRRYQSVPLVDAVGQPFKVEQLAGTEGFIFHYPYQSTPALLLDLGRQVSGGVGPSGGIVAFSAICPHQLAHPKPSLSAFNFHPGESATAGRSQAITCCLHGSAFDPAQAGAVIAGPAPRPLTVIELVYASDSGVLSAVGTRGAEFYTEFFNAFKRDLRERYGRSGYKQQAQGLAKTVAAGEYSQQRVNC
jgi:arsenite oxidase small subunit